MVRPYLLVPLLLVACAKGAQVPTAPLPSPSVEPVASADLYTATGEHLGLVSFSADAEGVRAMTALHGLTPYSVHGLHIHEGSSCSGPNFEGAGGHFSPMDKPHGDPAGPSGSHAGDLGNIAVNGQGASLTTVQRPDLAIYAPSKRSLVGKPVVLHADRDDMVSQPSGHAGPPLACGVIRLDPDGSPEDFKRSAMR